MIERFDHRPESAELIDLTRFMHGGAGMLLFCPNCAIALREEEYKTNYSEDVYDPDLMKHLYPRYLSAFAQDRRFYRPLVRDHAEVTELGSHLGAFLEAAELWGWRPTGIDIGRDCSSFARSRGLRVLSEQIENASIRNRSQDAVFVWNCFEQLENPASALRASYKILKDRGILLVRVPNFEFYLRLRAQSLRKRKARQLLGYNNLLGFPYRTGYTPASLIKVLRSNGFEPILGMNSHLLTAPYPELTTRIRREMRTAFYARSEAKPRQPHGLSGPWIEVVCRKNRALVSSGQRRDELWGGMLRSLNTDRIRLHHLVSDERLQGVANH